MKKVLLLTLVFLVSCSPRLRKNIIIEYPEFSDEEVVVVLELEDKQVILENKIGEIKAVDSGFSIYCTYAENIENLKILARESGANLVKITKYKAPAILGSDCHRFWADIYRVDNIKRYETEIEWSESRKLTWEDFKGKPNDKYYPNALAVTHSSIYFNYRISGVFRPKFIIRSTFENYDSWVKPEGRTDYVLRHEQIHFDITEIYTRKLRKAITELDKKSINTEKIERIFNRIRELWEMRQRNYDWQTAIGSKKEIQEKWEAIVKSELKEYDLYK